MDGRLRQAQTPGRFPPGKTPRSAANSLRAFSSSNVSIAGVQAVAPFPEVLEADRRPAGDRRQRFGIDTHGNVELFGKVHVESAEQGSSSGEHNTLVHQIG